MVRKGIVRNWALSLVVVSLGLSAAPASAGHWNTFCRHLGLGWSEGYHAHDQCPRAHGYAHHGHVHHRHPPMVWSEPGSFATAPASPPAVVPPRAMTTDQGDTALPSLRQSQRPVYRYK